MARDEAVNQHASVNQKDCNDISSAFWILKDPRSGFLELRPSTEEGTIASDSEKFEDACFRHLRPTDEAQVKRQDSSPLYVALHHFPPEIVLLCALTDERSPPVLSTLGTLSTISESTRNEIELNLGEEDRALIEEGKSAGTYHVFPNYGLNHARSDVKQGLKKVVRTEKKRRKASEPKEMASPKQSDENLCHSYKRDGFQPWATNSAQRVDSSSIGAFYGRPDPSDASATYSSSTLDPISHHPTK
jgi:hypothetical protein